jgi:Holliday junction resolvase
MTAMQRRKGACAEREVLRLLSEELGERYVRNVDQAREGGADCIQVKGFAIEVKRQERLSRPSWWRQAVDQAAALKAEPMLLYRRSREPWSALIHTRDGGYREATFNEAVAHIREKWARWP